MTSARVEAALRRIRAWHPHLAIDAESAAQWLLADGDVAWLSQAAVQTHLWWTVPTKLPDEDWDTAAAGAALLFDELGLDRYAAIARSETTAQILAAFRDSEGLGRRRFLAALRASGVDAVDTPVLAWGSIMGMTEAQARTAVEYALEDAIVDGRLVPGTAGGKRVAAAVTIATLQAPDPHAPGQSLLSLITTERAEAWVESARDEHHVWRQTAVREVLSPQPPPATAGAVVEPLRWLLQRAADGLALTANGYVARAFVLEAVEHFGWWDWDKPPRSEADVPQLEGLRDAAAALGLLRRRGRVVRTTAKGRALVDDDEALWRTTATTLGGRDDFNGMLAELAALRLLQGPAVDDDLRDDVTEILVRQGWRSGGEILGAQQLRYSVHRPLFWWRLLGLLDEEEPQWHAGRRSGRYAVALNEAGRATALEFLHARATGPRHRLNG